MDLIGELLISRNRVNAQLIELTSRCSDLQSSRKNLAGALDQFSERFDYTKELRSIVSNNRFDEANGEHDQFSELQFDRYDEYNILSRRIAEIGNDADITVNEIIRANQALVRETATLGRYVSQIQEDVSRARLAPIDLLFNRLERSVRDACVSTGTEAQFVTRGGDTLLDRIILDLSLIHI